MLRFGKILFRENFVLKFHYLIIITWAYHSELLWFKKNYSEEFTFRQYFD